MKDLFCMECKLIPKAVTSSGAYLSYCRECYNTRLRSKRAAKKAGTWVASPPRRVRKYPLGQKPPYRKLNPEGSRRYVVAYNAKIRLEGIAHYGGKCTCCGEHKLEFLTLEHLTPPPRMSTGGRLTGAQAWRKAKAQGWPDTHTVLCYNCNGAKGVHGTCPHTWGKYHGKAS